MHKDSIALVQKEMNVRALSEQILQYDEVLTMSAKMGAASGDSKWEVRYREFEPKLERDVNALLGLALEASVVEAAETNAAANAALVAMENQAFVLIRSGNRLEAAKLLESAEYERQKQNCAEGMLWIQTAVANHAKTTLATQRSRLTTLFLASGTVWALLIAVWVRVALLIRRFLRAKDDAEQSLSHANAVLEQRVADRTSEVVRANEVLQEETQQRLRMEIELRQAQKLESVGRLAAGVAHEINTPIQFVNDSVHFLQTSFNDLTSLLECYGAAHASGPPTQRTAEINRMKDEIDLPDLLESVPDALGMSIEGLRRISEIVRAMQDFAHPDQTDMTAVDLNRAIRSTLTMARNEYKYVAEVVTELNDLPSIRCHAGEINQVILNIVVNAAQAIGAVVKTSGQLGRITVRTRCDGDAVEIAISDTGQGIPAAIRNRIFDPFFTTKDVGQGTGQGLAITHSVIVGKHRGAVSFETEIGKGTTFFVRIPINGQPRRAVALAA